MEEILKSDLKLIVQEFVLEKSQKENYLLMEKIICSEEKLRKFM